jgi:hypothetical protein
MAHPGYPVEVQQPTNTDPNSEGTPMPPPYNPIPGSQGADPPNTGIPNGEMPVGMAPGMGEWAALAPMIPQQQPMPQQAQASPGMPVAAMRARIASTPPWRLSTEDIEQAMAMGIPEQEIWAVPGRVA